MREFVLSGEELKDLERNLETAYTKEFDDKLPSEMTVRCANEIITSRRSQCVRTWLENEQTQTLMNLVKKIAKKSDKPSI